VTWAGFWLPNLVQWVLGGAITALVGLYIRRAVRLREAEVQRLLESVEGLLGGSRAPSGRDTAAAVPYRRARAARAARPRGAGMRLSVIRKAIAGGVGFIVTGLLEVAVYATDLEPWLDRVVPHALVPLVPIVLGGVATVGAIYRASNAPLSEPAATVEPSPAAPELAAPPATLEQAAPVASPPAAAAATGAAEPFWSGVPAGEPSAATSLVQLLPAPSRSYQ
jgi:hypothetical protein